MPLFHVTIDHFHGTDLSIDSGKLVAHDGDEAALLSNYWIAKKLRDKGCKKHGGRCRIDIKKLTDSDGSGFLLPTAEEIP